MVNTTIVSRVFLLHRILKDMLSFLEYVHQRELDLDDIAVKYDGYYENTIFSSDNQLLESETLDPQVNKVYQDLQKIIQTGKENNKFPIEVFHNIEIGNKNNKIHFGLKTDNQNRKLRVDVLDYILKSLNRKYTVKGYNFSTGKDARISVNNNILITLKPNGRKAATAYTALDYIPEKYTETSKEYLDVANNLNGDASKKAKSEPEKMYVFRNANQMRRYVLAKVESNPKFNMTQREIIRNAFEINKIGDTIKDLEYDPKLLVSLGEILVPYLILKGKYQVVVSGEDGKIYNYLNTNAHTRIVYFPAESNNAKIDYFIDYKVGKNLFGRIKVSAKYGKGHAVNIPSLLPQAYENVILKNGNIESDDIFTRFYEITKNNNIKNRAEIFWSYYIPSIELGGKTYTGIELYQYFKERKDLYRKNTKVKNPITEETSSDKAFLSEFKQFISSNFKDTEINWKLVWENFPLSVSYLLVVKARDDFKKSAIAQHLLKNVIGACPYFQVRISDADARKGKFNISIIETNKSRNVEFKVMPTMNDITMSQGTLGYIIN